MSTNEQIARRVMKLKQVKRTSQIKDGCYSIGTKLDGTQALYIYRDHQVNRIFSPDTNPSDAMAVLERCVESGLDVLIMSFENEFGKRVYSVVEEGEKSGDCHNTLPAAICAFSLKLFP